MGERFKIEWLNVDGEVEDAQYVSLEQFEKEGIKRGRGVMPWAK
jgi:isopentenyldiphosphate isomerase